VGFIARENIAVGEVYAYTRGQRVDAEAVKANGWEDLVVGDGTKEAREIQADITGRDPADFETKTSAPAKPAATKEG
jgi:hypothetical protein